MFKPTAMLATFIGVLALAQQTFAAGTETTAATDDNFAPFGFLEFYLDDVVDVAALEAQGFALDPYYDPATFYSREDELEFTHGSEGYRLDIGVTDNVIDTIVVEFNLLVPTADDQGLDVRPNVEEIATEIASQLDAKYAGWATETWEYTSDEFVMSAFDFLSEDYALSMRISNIAITLIYTSAADRQTKEDFILDSGLPEETAPAETSAAPAAG